MDHLHIVKFSYNYSSHHLYYYYTAYLHIVLKLLCLAKTYATKVFFKNKRHKLRTTPQLAHTIINSQYKWTLL